MYFVTPRVPAGILTGSSRTMGHTTSARETTWKLDERFQIISQFFRQSHAVSKFTEREKAMEVCLRLRWRNCCHWRKWENGVMYQYVIYNMGTENKPKTNRYGFLLTSKKASHVVRLSWILLFSFLSCMWITHYQWFWGCDLHRRQNSPWRSLSVHFQKAVYLMDVGCTDSPGSTTTTPSQRSHLSEY